MTLHDAWATTHISTLILHLLFRGVWRTLEAHSTRHQESTIGLSVTAAYFGRQHNELLEAYSTTLYQHLNAVQAENQRLRT